MSNQRLRSVSNVVISPQVFLIVVLYVGPFSATPRNYQCRDDTDGLSSWARHLNNLTYSPLSQVPDQNRFDHDLTSPCPSFPHPSIYGAARPHNMSLCPWIYVMDYDYNRFPHEMAYARCSCGRCSTSDANGNQHECVPLYHAFHVIKRTCDSGSYRYFFTHESLPIGCVCSHRHGYLVDTTD